MCKVIPTNNQLYPNDLWKTNSPDIFTHTHRYTKHGKYLYKREICLKYFARRCIARCNTPHWNTLHWFQELFWKSLDWTDLFFPKEVAYQGSETVSICPVCLIFPAFTLLLLIPGKPYKWSFFLRAISEVQFLPSFSQTVLYTPQPSKNKDFSCDIFIYIGGDMGNTKKGISKCSTHWLLCIIH